MGKLLGLLLAAAVVCVTGCEKSRVIFLDQEENNYNKETLKKTESDAQENISPGAQTDSAVIEQTEAEHGERLSGQGNTKIVSEVFASGEHDGGTASETVTVFVCGAVKNPGVYDLPGHSRAKASVDAAGGFREDADTEWCNLAQLLYDGQKLRIYSLQETRSLESEGFAEDDADYSANTAGRLKEEAGSSNGNSGQSFYGTRASDRSDAAAGTFSAAEEGKLNLNTATKEQLMTLPGIGDARAESILSWRRQHGAFTQIEQIKEISGLKNAIFNQIKDMITVG